MENGPFEDVFPIKDGDIPASYVSLPEGKFDLSHKILIFFRHLPQKFHQFLDLCVLPAGGSTQKDGTIQWWG